ncbi:hypothetical protein PROFUN_04832 [Planoprotostelium fungivorum]|uniref:Uncharacterized protein n=1 Tax=Planoprotostelium fungivorum TaxID=1890364 RepID=A0A2P6NT12_9EUKA|nr:hypothetical protein PROFUN_04832 [Planoprotostelium fungivorum]
MRNSQEKGIVTKHTKMRLSQILGQETVLDLQLLGADRTTPTHSPLMRRDILRSSTEMDLPQLLNSRSPSTLRLQPLSEGLNSTRHALRQSTILLLRFSLQTAEGKAHMNPTTLLNPQTISSSRFDRDLVYKQGHLST